ncbi:hypothetical protein [Morganella morganii]|uniref:hypothetical protein n=1 Tax=Morganella morganii TaxID=582 RepID=UPI003EBD6374
MKKIGDITSTADKNGEWTNGSVAAGIAPTILEAGWLNSVQREILGVIIAAGMQQDKNDDTQLSKAISKIISGGDYATKTEVNSKLAKDQNGADIPNKDTFIKNLGLPELLNKKFDKTGGEITDTVTIKRGWEALVIESGASGVPSQINFKEGGVRTAFVGYGSNGSKHLGLVNDKTGTSFHVIDNDISVNGKSVMAGLVPIGGTIIWNSSVPYPDNFWPNEGRSFSAADYPELAKIFPNLKLPDDRGYAIRAADNGKGIDTGRVVGTYQGDAIRNIYGGFGARGNGTYEISGAMKVTTTTNWQVNDFAAVPDGGNRRGVTAYLDASTIVPTADENRMKNVAKILITRVK